MPVMRAMPLAFPGNALTRAHDMQFMCGDALLVAPVIAPGGEVDVALPPGAWYDLATRQRLAGRQLIRYRATLDPHAKHALPLAGGAAHQESTAQSAERAVGSALAHALTGRHR
jgi:alpha-D-xyloside xylohydrolase